MNRAEQELVMQLYDGELPGEQSLRVQRRVAADAEWRGVYQGLEQVGEVVRVMADKPAAAAADIADRLMQRIADERAGEPERDRPARVYRLPVRRVGAGLVAAAALAAAITLLVQRGRSPVEAPAQVAALSGTTLGALPAVASAPLGAASSPMVEPALVVPAVAIESVDFGAQSGSIFMVQSGETTTPVVWVMDEPAGARGRMEPL